MAKKIIVKQVECSICGYIYNSNEESECIQCRDTKELYEELFGPDDMDNKTGYPEL